MHISEVESAVERNSVEKVEPLKSSPGLSPSARRQQYVRASGKDGQGGEPRGNQTATQPAPGLASPEAASPMEPPAKTDGSSDAKDWGYWA